MISRGTGYFASKGYLDWDVVDYLKYTILHEPCKYVEAPALRQAFDLAIDTYIKELEKIDDDTTGKWTVDQRVKASRLIKNYRKVRELYSGNITDGYNSMAGTFRSLIIQG